MVAILGIDLSFFSDAINWIAGILHAIWCVITNLDKFVLYALIQFLNGIIIALGFLGEQTLALLPSLPDAPDWASTELPGDVSFDLLLGWINYVVPVPTILEIFATVGATFLAVYAIASILKMVKVMN